MKPKINQEVCIGCGTCASVLSDVFEMGAEGKAHVKKLESYDQYKDQITEAANACPVQAISVED